MAKFTLWSICTDVIGQNNNPVACVFLLITSFRQILAAQSANDSTEYITRGVAQDETDEMILETDSDDNSYTNA